MCPYAANPSSRGHPTFAEPFGSARPPFDQENSRFPGPDRVFQAAHRTVESAANVLSGPFFAQVDLVGQSCNSGGRTSWRLQLKP